MASPGNTSPLKAVVDKLIAGMSVSPKGEERISHEEMKAAWARAAGIAAAKRSRPSSLRKGRLVVTVADSSLLYDLTLRKSQVLETLIRDLKGRVKDLQFRIGDISEEEQKPQGKAPKGKGGR